MKYVVLGFFKKNGNQFDRFKMQNGTLTMWFYLPFDILTDFENTYLQSSNAAKLVKIRHTRIEWTVWDKSNKIMVSNIRTFLFWANQFQREKRILPQNFGEATSSWTTVNDQKVVHSKISVVRSVRSFRNFEVVHFEFSFTHQFSEKSVVHSVRSLKICRSLRSFRSRRSRTVVHVVH